jgi:ribosomal protein S18 acetylase RimI-like enzyme
VYVAPPHRSRGVGQALVEAALGFASTLPGITQVLLCVSEKTPPAVALYQRLGFVTWGIEPDALRVRGEPVADRHMIKRLA